MHLRVLGIAVSHHSQSVTSPPPAYKVLSNKEKRRLYDDVGHEAFLKNDASDYAEDEHEDGFHFMFADLFHDLDDGPFVEEQFYHWSFHENVEDERASYHTYSFEDHVFNVHFGDEYEEDHFF